MTTPDNGLRDLLRSLTGQTIAGGCDSCDAEQSMDEVHPGVFVNTIRHDDGCPFLTRYQAAGARHRRRPS
jgi:hypothetical protein